MNWKPAIKTANDKDWCMNALVFATEEEAKQSAHNLMMRWLAVTEYTALPTEDPVTHKFKEDAGHNGNISL